MALALEQFTCGEDNFGILIHDAATGQTAAIDAPEEAPIRKMLAARHWTLDRILTTHHHGDHTAGNLPLKAAFGCTITGPLDEAARIPGIDETVKGGDRFMFGSVEVRVLATPGHTLGHVTYWLPEERMAFVGDTLFAMGCGRVLEGTPEIMWASLEKLAALPDETAIYCGHEYTETNARFAVTIDPENRDLATRYAQVKALRAAGKPTLPTTIGVEKKTNPFLRVNDRSIRAHLDMVDAPAAAVFAEIRKRKDHFR